MLAETLHGAERPLPGSYFVYERQRLIGVIQQQEHQCTVLLRCLHLDSDAVERLS